MTFLLISILDYSGLPGEASISLPTVGRGDTVAVAAALWGQGATEAFTAPGQYYGFLFNRKLLSPTCRTQEPQHR